LGELSIHQVNTNCVREQIKFRDADPVAAIEEEEVKKAITVSRFSALSPLIKADFVQLSNMEFIYNAAKGPFCCGHDGHGEIKHDVRGSGILLPEDLHRPIHDLIAAVNDGQIGQSLNSLSDSQLKDIKTIFRVNLREGHEDKITVLFAPTPEFSTQADKKFTLFAKFDTPQYLEPAGARSYLAFHCKTHKVMYRIGIHNIRWNKKKTWATFENTKIDDLIGHPKKPVYDFGQPPIKF
jgi:hypothetical protein